jgi:hypothetical protein
METVREYKFNAKISKHMKNILNADKKEFAKVFQDSTWDNYFRMIHEGKWKLGEGLSKTTEKVI